MAYNKVDAPVMKITMAQSDTGFHPRNCL